MSSWILSAVKVETHGWRLAVECGHQGALIVGLLTLTMFRILPDRHTVSRHTAPTGVGGSSFQCAMFFFSSSHVPEWICLWPAIGFAAQHHWTDTVALTWRVGTLDKATALLNEEKCAAWRISSSFASLQAERRSVLLVIWVETNKQTWKPFCCSKFLCPDFHLWLWFMSLSKDERLNWGKKQDKKQGNTPIPPLPLPHSAPEGRLDQNNNQINPKQTMLESNSDKKEWHRAEKRFFYFFWTCGAAY